MLRDVRDDVARPKIALGVSAPDFQIVPQRETGIPLRVPFDFHRPWDVAADGTQNSAAVARRPAVRFGIVSVVEHGSLILPAAASTHLAARQTEQRGEKATGCDMLLTKATARHG